MAATLLSGAAFGQLTAPVEPRGGGVPTAAEALAVYRVIAPAVHTWSGLDATQTLPSVDGCSIVLRFGGDVVGRGTMIAGDDAQRKTAILDAYLAAKKEAEQRMPVGDDATRDEKLHHLAPDIQVSLELAGPLRQLPALLASDVDAAVPMGIEGVAVLKRDDAGAVRAAGVFPGTMIGGGGGGEGVTPGDALKRAVSTLSGEATLALRDPQDLGKSGYELRRFAVVHLAQPMPGAEPALLYRGQRLILQSDLDSVAELWEMADRLAINLANTISKAIGSEGIGAIGTRSLGGGVEPSDDAARELAVAMIALREYRRVRETSKIDGTLSGAAWRRAVESIEPGKSLLAAMHNGATPLPATLDLGECAMDGASRPERVINNDDDARKRIAGCRDGVRGVAAYALVTRGITKTPAPLRAAFEGQTPSTLAGEMPWLGWAELGVSGETVLSAAALREMRALIWKHQLTAADAGSDAQDLIGGIVVPGSRTPLPTWQTARLVAFLATMLRDERLTSKEERPGEMVRLLAAMRFLRQLQADETSGWMSKEPAATRCGLRNAAWDNRLRVDATAMALLADVEFIKSLEAIAK